MQEEEIQAWLKENSAGLKGRIDERGEILALRFLQAFPECSLEDFKLAIHISASRYKITTWQKGHVFGWKYGWLKAAPHHARWT